MENQTILSIVMILLLLVGCYFGILQVLKKRLTVRAALPAVIGILLFLFVLLGATMIFMAMILRAEVVLMACLLMIALGTLIMMVRFVLEQGRSLHFGSLALLLCYLLAVGYITMFSRSTAGDHRISLFRMDLFVKAVQMHSFEPLHHVFLNLAMFLPIGFLLPFVQTEKLGNLTITFFVSLTLSILIETIQLLTQIGQADLTDVAANTLGGLAGYLLCRLLRRILFAPDRMEDEVE